MSVYALNLLALTSSHNMYHQCSQSMKQFPSVAWAGTLVLSGQGGLISAVLAGVCFESKIYAKYSHIREFFISEHTFSTCVYVN